MSEQLLRALDEFERKERGIPQAHMAAQLVKELRAALAQPADGGEVVWRDLSDGEVVQAGDRILSSGKEWGLIEDDSRIAGKEFDQLTMWPVQRPAHTPPASQEHAEPAAPLGALAKRAIFDAIRGAYDLGYNDARNAKAVPGDNAPGYDGRNVEADHGGALLHRLNQLLKAEPAAQEGAWKMVPVKPTPEMLDAAVQAICYSPPGGFTRIDGPWRCWSAMIGATPTAALLALSCVASFLICRCQRTTTRSTA